MIEEQPENELNKKLPSVVVIGVGNLLLKDEGIGIHAAKALEVLNLPPDVKIIDAGTAPDLIAYTQAGDKLIIIDAARAGGKAGTIYRFQPEDLAHENGEAMSLHQLGVEQNLRFMSLMGNKPEKVVIIGIEPKEIDWGMELSPELQSVVPEIVKLILKEIDMEEPKIID
ncbi:hydrogenase maturation protease [Chloroflexota bacterium]